MQYNEEHNITPKALNKSKQSSILASSSPENVKESPKPKYYVEDEISSIAADPVVQYMKVDDLQKLIDQTQKAMTNAAKNLDFIEAAQLRDELLRLKEQMAKLENS